MSICRPLILACFSLGSVHAHAGVLDLSSVIGGANVYTLGNYSSSSSDVEGALVVGGNVNINGFSVNNNNRDAFGADGYALATRGNLSLTNGTIANGKVYVGGTTTLSSATAPASAGSAPLDFSATSAYFKGVSSNLAKVSATGTVSALYSGVKISGDGNGKVDVFNVASSMFANSSSWTLDKLTNGQTLIFNVSGSSPTFNNGGISFEPLAIYNVLFNFYEATQVNVNGIIGSVLAPNATVLANSGSISGNVIVNNWNSTTQVNATHYFAATEVAGYNLPGTVAIPEPGNLFLFLGGLGILGLLTKRRV